MDIPSLFMIPSAVSSGKVHSVFPNSTDADFDFNRDSDATRVNSEGLIERVGYYGSELVTNGNFATNTNWSFVGDGSISNGQLILPCCISNNRVSQSIGMSSSKSYKLEINITEITSGDTIDFLQGGAWNSFGTKLGINTVIISNPSDADLFLRNDNGTSRIKIDNVSVKEVLGDRARLNYEIEGGLVNTKPSLLLEPQSTNLVTYSEDFSNSYWTKGGVTTVTANFASPDGQNNAYKLSGANGTDRTGNVLLRNFNTGNSTFSLYVKSLGSTKIRFYFRDGTTGAIVNSGSFSLTNEYQRLTFSHNVANLSNFYIGDTDGDVLIFGAQIEALTYATSYIPTNGSTQTRAAETCNGAGTSSILPSEEGILYVEVSTNADSNFKRISIHSGSYVNSVFFDFDNTNNLYGKVIVGGSAVVTIIASGLNIENNNKIALSYKENDFKLFVNGSKVGTDVTGSTPTGLNNLSFDLAGGQDFYGKIRDIRVYNTKEMTDSEVDILLTKITS